MKAIILAAGLGTRLRPLTDSCPKALLPVNGKPMLLRWIEKMLQAGADEIVVTAFHHADMIVEYVKKLHVPTRVKIQVSDERPLLLDTGGGIARALSLMALSDPSELVLIANADILTDFRLESIMSEIEFSGADAALLVNPSRDTARKLLFSNSDLKMIGWTNLTSGSIRSPYPDTEVERSFGAAFSGIHAVRSGFIYSVLDYTTPSVPFSIIDFYIKICDRLNIRGFIPSFSYSWADIGKLDIYNSYSH